MGNVTNICKGSIAQGELDKRLTDVLKQITKEYNMTRAEIAGVLETVKLKLLIQ